MVHADLVVKAKGGAFKTVDIDRGSISALSSSSVTLSRPDKVSVTEAAASTTRFRCLPEAQLEVGDKALVISSAGQAIAIRSSGAHANGAGHRPPASAAPSSPAPAITTAPATGPPTTS